MRVLSISFSLKRGFGVLACFERTISTGNLLSQVGLARNLASRVAMLLQSDKNQPEIRPPLGRRAETGRKGGGGGGEGGGGEGGDGGGTVWNTSGKEREKERESPPPPRDTASFRMRRVQTSPALDETPGAVPCFVISRDILRADRFHVAHVYADISCTCIRAACRAPRRGARKNSRGNAKMRFTGAASHGRCLRESSCYIR